MPVEIVTSGHNVDVGAKAETVVGELEQDVYDIIQTQGATLSYPSEEAEDTTTGDYGGPISKRTISRGGDADFPSHLRFGGNRLLTLNAFRDTVFPSERTIVGASNIDYVLNGTHLDGATGLQIQAPTTTFNALITYAGATLNGAEGLLLLAKGFTNAGNNQPVMVKAVHDSGGLAKIDIFGGYGGGTAGDPFGAPKIAEALKSATLYAGSAVRNRQLGVGNKRALSIMVDYFEHATAARFNGLRGWVANDWSLAIAGKGPVIVTTNGNGRGWTPLQATPPNGETLGSHFSAAGDLDPMYIGAEDLVVFAIVPYANVLVATAVPILLADTNIKSGNLNLAGQVAVINDIVGTDELVPRRGMHNPAGSVGWYMTDATIAEQITKIGAKATRQDGAVHALWKDALGQYIAVNFLKNNFKATGPGGGRDAVEGTLEFGSMALSKNARAVVFQEYSVGP